MAKRKKSVRLPTSKDKLVDWFFKELIYFIKKKLVMIEITKGKIVERDVGKKELNGFIVFNPDNKDGIVFLSGSGKPRSLDKNYWGRILTHELCHAVLESHVIERKIRRLEKLLWERFTVEQKRILISFLPRKRGQRRWFKKVSKAT